MRKMILAMLLLALALGGATLLDHAGLEASFWLVAIVGGAGGLMGGLAGGLLQEARG